MSSLEGKQVLVVGAGFGGLSAAAHLSKKGADVRILEQAKTVGGKAAHLEKDGFVFDAGPTLLTMPEELRRAFSAARAERAFPRLQRVDPSCHYRFASGHELVVQDDIEKTRAGIRAIDEHDARVFPDFLAECARIAKIAGAPYMEAPFQGYVDFAKRVMKRGPEGVKLGMALGTLHGLSSKWFRSPEMQMLVDRFATYAGGSPYESSAAFAMIAHLEMKEGAFYPEGGMHVLARRLQEALVEAGVTFQFETEALGLLHEGGRVRGVRTSAGEERADLVVADVDPAARWLAGGGARGHRSVRSLSGFVLAFGFEGDALPVAHNVFFPKDYGAEFRAIFEDKAIAAEPTVYLSIPSLFDRSRAPAGHHVGFAMINAPAAHDEAYWDREGGDLRSRIFTALEPVLPNLRARIRTSIVRTPCDLRKTGAPQGEIYGAAPHGRLATFDRPPNRDPRKGLYFVGGATHPGGGVPMVTLGGRLVADMIEGDLS